MDSDIPAFIIVSLVVVAYIFLIVLGGTFIGGLVGWALSHTFMRDWLLKGFAAFGFNMTGRLVHIGAVFGFIGGFFKATLTESSS